MSSLFLIKPLQKAFTLIELMIVIAIIAILATVAIPSYNSYTKKAALSELLAASSAYKTDVEICVYNLGRTDGCNNGENGIKNDKLDKSKYVASVAVENGEITVKGKESLKDYSYTMKPELQQDGHLTWKTTCNGADTSLFPANFCSTKE
ncbi:prepilin-type N-terminal cleavage/methylation domain-containing protein [[Haemophilus] ducreyi]|uniref:Prepilin peptidase dependent protein D n=2 Tax=Haemophilus ducreyi TaxID=730 RepID=Q7VM74_HAEDU|nr:prepilin peptidase-dependent pilin [[Haemophilus] ducreyi]AAP95986.1 putative prepilin peptidase dependent protein D [[Haemophilus] ducreyi 35000HP]AKO30983.1 prepilin peptidase [[Haemophilus] ducreyi]AKO32425.1 prepilin peptidase [[Haemophilus] ducreyi]AKO33875.1 prepilin peptidase [[Haemophilus] ducreyi]AKO35323.1 prepilin peptidase [[Haemophilus] ducreyi]